MPSPAEILGPEGRIAARMPLYEHRSQQLAMAEAVDKYHAGCWDHPDPTAGQPAARRYVPPPVLQDAVDDP